MDIMIVSSGRLSGLILGFIFLYRLEIQYRVQTNAPEC